MAEVPSVQVGCPGDQSADLAETARRFRIDRASPEELSLAFGEAVLFCPISSDGVRTVEAGASSYVPLYSSERTLARGEGPCEWFSGAGIDLVGVVPEGAGIVIDRGSDSEVVLENWAIHRSVAPDEALERRSPGTATAD